MLGLKYGNAPKYAYFSESDSQIRRLRCTYQGIALLFRTKEVKALHIHAYIMKKIQLSVAKTKKLYCPTNSPVLRYYSYTSKPIPSTTVSMATTAIETPSVIESSAKK